MGSSSIGCMVGAYDRNMGFGGGGVYADGHAGAGGFDLGAYDSDQRILVSDANFSQYTIRWSQEGYESRYHDDSSPSYENQVDNGRVNVMATGSHPEHPAADFHSNPYSYAPQTTSEASRNGIYSDIYTSCAPQSSNRQVNPITSLPHSTEYHLSTLSSSTGAHGYQDSSRSYAYCARDTHSIVQSHQQFTETAYMLACPASEFVLSNSSSISGSSGYHAVDQLYGDCIQDAQPVSYSPQQLLEEPAYIPSSLISSAGRAFTSHSSGSVTQTGSHEYSDTNQGYEYHFRDNHPISYSPQQPREHVLMPAPPNSPSRATSMISNVNHDRPFIPSPSTTMYSSLANVFGDAHGVPASPITSTSPTSSISSADYDPFFIPGTKVTTYSSLAGVFGDVRHEEAVAEEVEVSVTDQSSSDSEVRVTISQTKDSVKTKCSSKKSQDRVKERKKRDHFSRMYLSPVMLLIG